MLPKKGRRTLTINNEIYYYKIDGKEHYVNLTCQKADCK